MVGADESTELWRQSGPLGIDVCFCTMYHIQGSYLNPSTVISETLKLKHD